MNVPPKYVPAKARWSVGKIAMVLYPLAVGAAAVNIFFFGLLLRVVGFTPFTPLTSLWIGFIGGLPMALFFARHMRKLIDSAESDPS